MLLNLERVVGGGFAYNLTTLILRSLMEYGSSIVEYIVSKVVCFGSNGVVMFTNMHTSVATQSRFKFAHFLITIHYMAH